MKPFALLALLAATLALVAAAPFTGASAQDQIDLDYSKYLAGGNDKPFYEYMRRPDDVFDWQNTGITIDTDEYTGYVLNFTSQTWLSEKEVADGMHVWTHKLVMIVPTSKKQLYAPDTVPIYVTKGHNNGRFPDAKDIDIISGALLSLKLNCIVGVLFQIPNQKLTFLDDPLRMARSEDAAVAYTWRRAVEERRPEWVIYFPMAKAVERAMDVITSWSMMPETPAPAHIEKFFISGASKRGAASWFVGAYEGTLPKRERRVIGIAPQVFSALNFGEVIPHIYTSLGNWTFALEDYVRENITDYIGTPDMDYLVSLVDPLEYSQGLANIPKLVISATGDEFFLPDDDWHWWDALAKDGLTSRLMLPNAEHTMASNIPLLVSGLAGFYASLVSKQQIPGVVWALENGNIVADVERAPTAARMWYTKSAVTEPQRRDFRMIRGIQPFAPCTSPGVEIDAEHCLVPLVWLSKDLKAVGEDGRLRYSHSAKAPEDGSFGAFFFQFDFPVQGTGETLSLSTQVQIVPDVMPFKPCAGGSECHGDFV